MKEIKRKMKKNKEQGITLVALVVTIIILLILAGVAIRIVSGDNGLFKRSRESVNTWKSAEEEEKGELEKAEEFIEGEINDSKNVDKLKELEEHPDNFKHPDQSETNRDRAIGTDGQPVNLDLWKYVIIDEEKKEIELSEDAETSIDAYYTASAYRGEYTSDGRIYGSVPNYIKIDGKEGIYTVTSMECTFANIFYELRIAPEIPNTVTNMNSTFYKCMGLWTAPKLPNSVTNMTSTFRDCGNLTTAPEIPNSVTDMNHTFSGCSNLTTAPEIPNSVTNMDGTFFECTSLTGTVRVNSKNVNDGEDCFGSYWNNTKEITLQVPANSTTYTEFNQRYGSSSNVTIETFTPEEQ